MSPPPAETTLAPAAGRRGCAAATLSDMQRIRDALRRARHPALALLTAFLLGALVIVLTDFEHLRQLGTDPLAAIGGALAGVLDGYGAMFSGAIGDPDRIVTAIRSGTADDVAAALRPISETLVSATPFIFAGLGLAVSFRAGLFNLGVDGQFLIGGLGTVITATLVAGSPAAAARPGGRGARRDHRRRRVRVRSRLPQGADGGARADHHADAQRHRAEPRVPHRRMDRSLGRRRRSPPCRGSSTCRRSASTTASSSRSRWPRSCRGCCSAPPSASSFGRPASAAPPPAAAGIRPGRTTILAMSLSAGLVGMGSAFFALGPAWGSSGAPVRPGVCRHRPRPARAAGGRAAS